MDKTRGKAPWGAYSAVLWRFYRSGERKAEKEYSSVEEAASAQKAMLNRMNHRRIYDVRITRRRNILYLERMGVEMVREAYRPQKSMGEDYKQQIMKRFCRVE